MKTNKIVIFGVVLVITLGTAWFLLQKNHHHAGSTYTCPMHPQIKSDKKGSCPICGMDLVLIESETETEAESENDKHNHNNHDKIDESHKSNKNNDWENLNNSEENSSQNKLDSKPLGHSEVKLTLNKQQMIGIKLGKVEKKSLFKSIHAPGRIAFDPELYTAQSEYLEALSQWNKIKNSPLIDVRENTKQMIQSSKIRLKILGLSDDQISNLAKKGSQTEGLLVSGMGQDNWIYADIFEMDLPYIKKGQPAQITANFLQGKTLSGKVISVDQVINPNTRTAKVRVQLDENHPSIRPESYVNITIFAPVGEHTSVPLEAILETGRESYIFVKKDKGFFEPRKISVILETDLDAAIGSGAQPGEEIVIGGNFMLASESRLKSVVQDTGSSASGHNH
ncbi:MAG: efflux RND transporter periplasmic adaptor subunit [Bdellovibrionaceae bacterium]|nr:efflux RND transporter periplasmic adaptor subunit [Pseudobdellovibrionaceae bacterium]